MHKMSTWHCLIKQFKKYPFHCIYFVRHNFFFLHLEVYWNHLHVDCSSLLNILSFPHNWLPFISHSSPSLLLAQHCGNTVGWRLHVRHPPNHCQVLLLHLTTKNERFRKPLNHHMQLTVRLYNVWPKWYKIWRTGEKNW